MSDVVLITGARAIAALDIARDFKRLGYKVHLADSQGGTAARLSRFVDGHHTYASPRHKHDQFSADLTKLVDQVKPRLIIPTCEEVFHLALLPHGHVALAKLFAPPLDVLARLHDKADFAALCVDLDLPVPMTHKLTNQSEVLAFASTSSEWVFKPCFSRFGTHTLVGPSAQALTAIVPTPQKPWVAQAMITGEEVCFQAIAHAGKLSAFVAYRGIWRLDTGASLAFECLSDELTQQLLAIAARLAKGLCLTGQFACDVMLDASGSPWLIECNPRATSGVHLMPDDGRLASAYLGPSDQTFLGQATGSRHLAPAMWSLALLTAFKRGKLKAWSTAVQSGRDVAGITGDPLPAIGAVIDGLFFVLRGLALGVSPTAATTYDIEWNGDLHDQPAS
jgi:predicted ATP-grasp superfamily ATP-dependent carboligase